MVKAHVYEISDFKKGARAPQLYVNRLGPHVAQHSFTNLPHKHDFYLFMLVTKGSGTHEIDFIRYPVKAGSIFLMQPGQMHFWKLSRDIDGFVFFHSKAFYEQEFTRTALHHFKFFESFRSIPNVEADKRSIKKLSNLLEEMLIEFRSNKRFGLQKLHALMNVIYIEAARVYPGKERPGSPRYLDTFHQFEDLIEQHYQENKLPRFYASKLTISEKHLNRICRECVNKTSTRIIADRVSLEAKRLLSQFKQNITEISFDLGFNDPSYFVRFFKKQTGETPLAFQKKYFD